MIWKKGIKGKLQKAISVLLLLAVVLLIPSTAYADSTQDFINSETYLRTSYNNDNYVGLSISGNTLTVSGKLQLDGLTGLMVNMGRGVRNTLNVISGQEFSVRVALSHSGQQPISIYTKTSGESSYWGYIWDKIYIEKADGGYRIMPSLVLDQNLSFARAYVDPDNFRDSSKVPDSVKSISKQIVGGETDDYAKVFLLHKWVAENIYYDYDAYRGNMHTFYNSADILANKRSVCEGYANLLRDLILAQGIPCMKASTYSLGVSTNGGSYAVRPDEANVTNSNHAHVEAWVDRHWVVMDPTWDSNNKYENGNYNAKTPNGFYYFDITPEALAFDHKYINRANGKLRMQNGTLVGADTPAAAFSDVSAGMWYADPVAWAVEKNITNGTSTTKFSPGQDCTHAQILTFLYRADRGQGKAEAADMDKAVAWARQKGMIGASFDGSKPCTRVEAVNYIWQALGKESAPISSFTDVPATAAYAKAVSWAVEKGVTNGTNTAQTQFSPDTVCNRGTIVTFLYRAYKN